MRPNRPKVLSGAAGPRPAGTSPSGERGQIVPIVAVLVALGVAAAVGIVELADEIVERGEAQAVADATALGGALDGRAAAERIAAANGVALVAFRVDDDTVVSVEIAVGRRRARASARLVER